MRLHRLGDPALSFAQERSHVAEQPSFTCRKTNSSPLGGAPVRSDMVNDKRFAPLERAEGLEQEGRNHRKRPQAETGGGQRQHPRHGRHRLEVAVPIVSSEAPAK